MFESEVVKKINQNTFCVQEPFSENHSVYERECKNMTSPETTQITIKHDACALHAA
jgi:hypothetical protein